ncbi:MAG: hypothetical protein ACOCV2_03900 [Persicimonas sp.]
MSEYSTVFLAMFVLAIGGVGVACGGGDDNNKPVTVEDTGDEEPDAGDGGQSDADAGETDGGDDGGGTEDDRDGDGVPDDEDNCPDEPNENQTDRDRDGVGDACDHMPTVHDPDNPDSLDDLLQDEEDVARDNIPLPSDGVDLELPFAVDGNVSEAEGGQPDSDVYTFEVDEPTVLAVNLDGRDSNLWPAAQVIGYNAPAINVRRFILTSDEGQDHFREVFLPVPGMYSLIVSDLRNWSESSGGAGGENSNYRLIADAIPFPDVDPVELPMNPDESEADATLNTFEVDTEEVDALEVEALGDWTSSTNTVNLPLVHLYDPDAERSLAFNTPGQVSTSSAEVELTSKVGDSERVWVIQDHWQRQGETDNVVEIAETEFDSEFETFDTPQDERFDELVWLQPGLSIDGTIGPPRTVDETELEADEDYYLLNTKAADMVTINVAPGEDSDLQPEVQLGTYQESPDGSGGFSSDFLEQKTEEAEEAGQPASVSQVIDSSRAGELAVRVRHAPNVDSESPEGGEDYNYEISMQAEEPEFDDVGELPAVVEDEYDDVGELAYHSFEAEEGERYNIRHLHPFGTIALLDADSFEVLQTANYSDRLTWRAEEDGEYVVAVQSYVDSGGADYTVAVERISATKLDSTPASDTGAVELAPFSDWYSLEVSEGEAYEVAADVAEESELDAEIYVYDGEDMSRVGSGGSSLRFLSNFDGEVFIGVADGDDGGPADDSDDTDFSFKLQVDELDSEEIALDSPESGQLNDGSHEIYYGFDAPAGAIEAQVEADGDWTPKVELVDAGTLQEASGELDYYRGTAFYAESEGAEYALRVSARDTSLSDPLDFDIEVTVHEPDSAIDEDEPNDDPEEAQHLDDLPVAIQGSLEGGEDEEDYYSFDVVTGEHIWFISSPSGDTTNLYPRMHLNRPDGSEAAYDSSSGESLYPAFFAFEADQTGTWNVEHYYPYDDESSGDYMLYAMTSGHNDFDESEPNDDESEAQDLGEVDLPTRIGAEVDGDDPVDVFSFTTVRELDALEVFLEEADDGFELRLLDENFDEIEASGPDHDGDNQPTIEAEDLAPGDYFIELDQGDASGEADVIVVPDP